MRLVLMLRFRGFLLSLPMSAALKYFIGGLLFACWHPNVGLGVEPSSTPPPLIELQLTSGIERGLPIAWNTRQVLLLRTDGSIGDFKPNYTREYWAENLDAQSEPETAGEVNG